MLKVAFLHNYFPSGGAERVTIDVANYLSAYKEYKVYVYASKIAWPLMTDGGGRNFILRKIPTQAISARRARMVERLIIDDGIDVLVQVVKAIPGIERIKARTSVKTIVACHGEPFWQRYAIVHRRQSGIFRKLMWNLFNKRRYEDGTLAMRMAISRTQRDYDTSDAYTVLCESYKQETASALGIDSEYSHIYAIENSERPVDCVNYCKENIILFVGRFENWSKRIDRLLRIWQTVQWNMCDWKLVLVGDGADWYRMKRLAEELHLERVSFDGRRDDVSEYYRRASVVALTSETEGWPLALTEGQAHGCICVAFGCTSGVKDVLSPDGECGFVVPAFDEYKYAETLLRIAAMTDEERLRIRKGSVVKRREYAPEIIYEKWRLLLDELCMKK